LEEFLQRINACCEEINFSYLSLRDYTFELPFDTPEEALNLVDILATWLKTTPVKVDLWGNHFSERNARKRIEAAQCNSHTQLLIEEPKAAVVFSAPQDKTPPPPATPNHTQDTPSKSSITVTL
jgi:hypothetical protein